jgi:hypothetical protein
MTVSGILFDGDQVELSMPHTALGDECIAETLNLFGCASQYDGFQTVVVVKMDMG